MTFSYVFAFTRPTIKLERRFSNNNNNNNNIAEHERAGRNPAFPASYRQATPPRLMIARRDVRTGVGVRNAVETEGLVFPCSPRRDQEGSAILVVHAGVNLLVYSSKTLAIDSSAGLCSLYVSEEKKSASLSDNSAASRCMCEEKGRAIGCERTWC